MTDGNCTCRPGYYRNKLCYSCTFPGCQTCSNSSGCDTCSLGLWGPTCNKECPVWCEGHVCGMSDGSCTCRPGYVWYAGQCQPCSSPNCLTCSPPDCDTCKPGVCFNCLTVYLGTFCNDTCPLSCSSIGCDRESGACYECSNPTKYGPFCNKPCSEYCTQSHCAMQEDNCTKGCIRNHFGPKCDHFCSEHCKPVANGSTCDGEGRCVLGCVDGFSGADCGTGMFLFVHCNND